MEHVAGGQFGLSVLVYLPFGAFQIAVAADDLFGIRIPHDELLVAIVAGVKLVDVYFLARAASRLAEGNFPQASYFAHHVGSVMCRNDKDFVVAFVGHAQL